MRRLASFFIYPLIVGILVAIILLFTFPQLLSTDSSTADQTSTSRTTLAPASYSSAIKKASPAVVNIFSNRLVREPLSPYWNELYNDPFFRQFFGLGDTPTRERLESSLGSGVIMDNLGHILTNYHVIEGADTILVATQDGRESLATVIGTDPESDLALLKIDLPALEPIRATQPRVETGDVVFAIGNPFGVGQTVSMGIISGTGRSHLGLAEFENFIQTDAAVNPGNSGGALINAYGELVGINTAIFSRSGGFQGISFAIPISQAEKVMVQLLEHGRVIRGFFGASMSQLSTTQLQQLNIDALQGLVITDLIPNAPAMNAGLQRGDIIIGMAGNPIRNARMAQQQVVNSQPGDELEIQYYRDGELLETEVKIGVRPQAGQTP